MRHDLYLSGGPFQDMPRFYREGQCMQFVHYCHSIFHPNFVAYNNFEISEYFLETELCALINYVNTRFFCTVWNGSSNRKMVSNIIKKYMATMC